MISKPKRGALTWLTLACLIAMGSFGVAAGTETHGLVQYADVLPTLIDAARGAWRFEPFDGHSFLPTLVGETHDTGRKFAYGIHNNLPEGPIYPIRTISNGAYRLILNLQPDRLYIEKRKPANRTGSLDERPTRPRSDRRYRRSSPSRKTGQPSLRTQTLTGFIHQLSEDRGAAPRSAKRRAAPPHST